MKEEKTICCVKRKHGTIKGQHIYEFFFMYLVENKSWWLGLGSNST
jgi:hypothetical protein